MGPRAAACLLALLRAGAALRPGVGVATEVINLDLPAKDRWRQFALKHRDGVLGKARTMGRLYEESLGPEIVGRWMKAAPVPEDLMEEYTSIVETVNHSDVTLQRLIITDMWHAVHAPTFGCTGLLAATENGTVMHGRNIDYGLTDVVKQAMKVHVNVLNGGGGGFFDGIFEKNGRQIVSFVGSIGGLGIHTGMRIGGYSWNSNARLVENDMMKNLVATEKGSKNFPWVARQVLTEIPDFQSAVAAFSTTNFNAPNYFILAGAGPFEGAVVTVDRGGVREVGTPPVQWLDKDKGIWHLVQTNDDLLEEPLDRRRGTALERLGKSSRSRIDMDFVEGEMEASPVFNPDTLLTWVANPRIGTHRLIVRPLDPLARMFEKDERPLPRTGGGGTGGGAKLFQFLRGSRNKQLAADS